MFLKKRNILRLLAVVLCVFMVLPCSISAAEVQKVSTDRIVIDYNGYPSNSEFVADAGTGASWQGGNCLMKIVGSSDAIAGKSLAINTCDIRWWAMNYSDEEMNYEFDFKLSENYATNFIFAVNSQDPTTTSEGLGGAILWVRNNSSGEPALFACNDQELTTLETGRKYHVELLTKKGYDTYTVKLDGEPVGGEGVFVSAIYSVADLRMNADSSNQDSYIMIDNFRAYTVGRAYPQPYSFQPVGEMPVMELTPTDAPETLTLFCNKINTGIAPVEKDGTYYLALIDVLAACDIAYTEADGDFTIGDLQIGSANVSGDCKVTVEGQEYDLTGMLYIAEDGRLMASLKAINVLCGVKVWLDDAAHMLVLTTPAYLDNILRILGGKLYMNGEPFYEISFNKFDLNWQIQGDARYNNGIFPSRMFPNEDYTFAAAEEALRQLAENGFHTIRVFCNNINPRRTQEEKDIFYAATDAMYDMCDKYGIQVVACLSLPSATFFDEEYIEGYGWIDKDENLYDLMTNPDSESRKILNEFIEEYVNRYKDRDSILMWEIVNEGNLNADIINHGVVYSALQLGNFYADCATEIRKYDSERLITGGDGMIRSAQWHLFQNVMNGGQSEDWTVDNVEQRQQITAIINHGLDVVSIHGYGVGYQNGSGHDVYIDENGRSATVTYELFMKEAAACGKVLFNGETGGYIGEGSYGNADPAIAPGRAAYLDTIIDAGVQLSLWWSFHSDRADQNCDRDSWSVRADENPESFNAIKTANEKLKAAYVVNAAADANLIPYEAKPMGTWMNEADNAAETDEATGNESNADVNDNANSSDNLDTSKSENGVIGWIIAGAAVLLIAVVAVIAVAAGRKKNK